MGATWGLRERQRERVACEECGAEIAAGSLSSHLMTRHGKAAPRRHLWAPQTTGGPRTYKITFPQGSQRQCPLEGCPGVSETQAAMRVNFVHRHVHDTVVGGGCPPPRSPRCCGRAGARSAPASPLVSQTPPGIPPTGIAVGFLEGNLSCMSWAPQLSGGPRGAAVEPPSRVESSRYSKGIRPRIPHHTPRMPLSLSVAP